MQYPLSIMKKHPKTFLAGDVGGTKTDLALFSGGDRSATLLAEDTLPSARFESMEALVRTFLKACGGAPEFAVFGVAGPVVEGRAEITNLPWVLEERGLCDALGLERVRLLNDLAAIANAVPGLKERDLHLLKPGEARPEGAKAVVAPGTGLGEAFLTWDGSRYQAHPSEGGHADFGPRNEREDGLLRFLRRASGHVSWERVCSGMGIANIYRYLKEEGIEEEPPALAEALRKVKDPVPVITDAAKEGRHPLCVEALRLFVQLLGAEAGNLALKVMATGGVYLGGGIPPRVLDLLVEYGFTEAFTDKGRLSHIVKGTPVYVILNPKAALLGAAAFGGTLMET